MLSVYSFDQLEYLVGDPCVQQVLQTVQLSVNLDTDGKFVTAAETAVGAVSGTLTVNEDRRSSSHIYLLLPTRV